MNILKRGYNWVGKQVHTPYAALILSLFFFIEASFFFIPVDPILVLYCIEHRKRMWYFTSVATISSVVGGIFGYIIGFGLWETIGNLIVNNIISELTFSKVIHWFTVYENIAVLVAGFTPVPYKAVTIGAGFCKLPIIPFIFYSIIARGGRFYLITLIVYLWGPGIKDVIAKYFNLLAILFPFIILGGFWVIKLVS